MSLGLEVTVCFLNLALDKVTQLLWAWVSTSYSHTNPAWHCVCAPEGRTSPSSFQPGSYPPVSGLYLTGNDGKSYSEKSFCSWKEL